MQAEKGRGMNLRGRLFSNTTYFKCIRNRVAPAQYFYNEKLEKTRVVTCYRTNSFLKEELIFRRNCWLGYIYIYRRRGREMQKKKGKKRNWYVGRSSGG